MIYSSPALQNRITWISFWKFSSDFTKLVQYSMLKRPIYSILCQSHGIVAYGGRKLREAETRRAIPEKELLSVVFAITTSHRDFLFANVFTLFTDARAINFLEDFQMECPTFAVYF